MSVKRLSKLTLAEKRGELQRLEGEIRIAYARLFGGEILGPVTRVVEMMALSDLAQDAANLLDAINDFEAERCANQVRAQRGTPPKGDR